MSGEERLWELELRIYQPVVAKEQGGKGAKGSDKKESQMIDHRWVKAA